MVAFCGWSMGGGKGFRARSCGAHPRCSITAVLAPRGGPTRAPARAAPARAALSPQNDYTTPPFCRPRTALKAPPPTPPAKPRIEPPPPPPPPRLTLQSGQSGHVALAPGVLQPRVSVVLDDYEIARARNLVDLRPPRRPHRRAGRVLARGDGVDGAREGAPRGGARGDDVVQRGGHHALAVQRDRDQLVPVWFARGQGSGVRGTGEEGPASRRGRAGGRAGPSNSPLSAPSPARPRTSQHPARPPTLSAGAAPPARASRCTPPPAGALPFRV